MFFYIGAGEAGQRLEGSHDVSCGGLTTAPAVQDVSSAAQAICSGSKRATKGIPAQRCGCD